MLFVSSVVAYQPAPPLALYGVSKTALLGLVKALATELGERDVRVNGIAPGIIPTKFSAALVQSDKLRSEQVCTSICPLCLHSSGPGAGTAAVRQMAAADKSCSVLATPAALHTIMAQRCRLRVREANAQAQL